ncbi:phage QLRG family, putative DNA packaging [Klebsiella pneumoniae]|uniref:Phage QLRG family, putative DNA packaging n=1 Tax=Klebsiella pneumoniae TaxID=573 RepID=A0A378FXL4_KLEPN|nr:phage QLRG family, putative DNA packaging [Klebsiella pneumoniae]
MRRWRFARSISASGFDNGLEFTPAIKIGCLMYVSQLYEYRTMIGDADAKEIPMAVSALWSVYRDVGVY